MSTVHAYVDGCNLPSLRLGMGLHVVSRPVLQGLHHLVVHGGADASESDWLILQVYGPSDGPLASDVVRVSHHAGGIVPSDITGRHILVVSLVDPRPELIAELVGRASSLVGARTAQFLQLQVRGSGVRAHCLAGGALPFVQVEPMAGGAISISLELPTRQPWSLGLWMDRWRSPLRCSV